jgi:hypothetical protein
MMMQPDEARLVDPVLTNHAQGYAQPRFVGHLLFPRVEVKLRGGKAIEFGTESFRKYNTRRAPGADAMQVEFGYAGKPFELVQDSLDVPVPKETFEDARLGTGIDLGLRAVNVGMGIMTLSLEAEQADIASNPASYAAGHVKEAATAAEKWTDAASDPIGDIEQGAEAIRQATGMEPNVLVLGAKVFRPLRNHPKVLERLKGVSADAVTEARLAAMLDIETVAVGKAVFAEKAGFADVWGPHAFLAYAPEKADGPEVPSFAYTYTLQGNPSVMQPYWDHGKRSWLYGVTYERAPVLTGMGAGFLIRNVV